MISYFKYSNDCYYKLRQQVTHQLSSVRPRLPPVDDGECFVSDEPEQAQLHGLLGRTVVLIVEI